MLPIKKEVKTIVYDNTLCIETYRFEGIVQPFPNHFHEHYVIGFIENGKRCLYCKNNKYNIKCGDIILFNPQDNHACVQTDNATLDYRGINISKQIMLHFTEEITKKTDFPIFYTPVVSNDEAIYYLRCLHEMIMNGTNDFKKEEHLLFLLSTLIQNYAQHFESQIPECRKEIEKACEFMEKHFYERIYLDQICHHVGLSKSTLLRAFTKSKGITPYRYLETIRINEAKKLLKKGISPVDVAIQTGFSDQSHFTNYFSSFIGITPNVYREIFYNKQ